LLASLMNQHQINRKTTPSQSRIPASELVPSYGDHCSFENTCLFEHF
jgi:hypothetical protein